MSTQDLVPSPVGPVDVEQAEAALVERYPRLVRIAYLVLPPSLGRNRRVLTAHALVQRSLPRRRVPGPAVPGPRRAEDAVDPGYAYVRGEVLRQALIAGLPLRRLALPRRAQFPPLLPHVWGLRLFPRVGGADELALDQQLSRLSGAGRAAYVLRGLERQGDPEVLRVLAAAGVEDPAAALAEADALEDGALAGPAIPDGPRRDGPARVGEQGGPGRTGGRGGAGPFGGAAAGPGDAGHLGGTRRMNGSPNDSGTAPGAGAPEERSDRVGEQAGPGRTGGGTGAVGRVELPDSGPGDAAWPPAPGSAHGRGAGRAGGPGEPGLPEGPASAAGPGRAGGPGDAAGATRGPGPEAGAEAGAGAAGTGRDGGSGATAPGAPTAAGGHGRAAGTGHPGATAPGGPSTPGGTRGHGRAAGTGRPGVAPPGGPSTPADAGGHNPARTGRPEVTPPGGPSAPVGAGGHNPARTGRPGVAPPGGPSAPVGARGHGSGATPPGGPALPRRLSGVALLESDEFDPCALQARPTDLMRRRQHARAAFVALVAVVVCGTLLGLPGDGWGRNGAAAPSYARNPAAEAALDPAAVKKADPAAWPAATRQDFSVWPARGGLTGDTALLRRALAVWARPGGSVRSSATPGTPVGPPMGPPQLLFAGQVDAMRVVLFHDGLRAVRYAEPVEGTAGAALDFARTDAADTVGAAALVVSRASGNVRYLMAPWVRETAVRDLLAPAKSPRPLGRDAFGVTDPLPGPAPSGACTRWNTLQVRDRDGLRLLTDLGELAPARLLWGPPSAASDATGTEARKAWARTACQLTAVRAHGVRSVNAWRFARQPLPEGAGQATWVCTRAETWRGTGSRVLAQFLVPSPEVPAALAARSEGSPACGVRDPRVLAGVLWKAPGGAWFVVAAGSPDFTSLETSGGVKGRSDGPLLAVRAGAGARADLDGTLPDGTRRAALR
ncbi:hypothetical protein ACWGN5_39225 [Streptomyces sp. NPDC055815]